MRVSEKDRTQDGVSTGAILARRERTLTGSTAIVSVRTLLFAATLLPCAARAPDATWGANPASSDWNTAANWSLRHDADGNGDVRWVEPDHDQLFGASHDRRDPVQQRRAGLHLRLGRYATDRASPRLRYSDILGAVWTKDFEA